MKSGRDGICSKLLSASERLRIKLIPPCLSSRWEVMGVRLKKIGHKRALRSGCPSDSSNKPRINNQMMHTLALKAHLEILRRRLFASRQGTVQHHELMNSIRMNILRIAEFSLTTGCGIGIDVVYHQRDPRSKGLLPVKIYLQQRRIQFI